MTLTPQYSFLLSEKMIARLVIVFVSLVLISCEKKIIKKYQSNIYFHEGNELISIKINTEPYFEDIIQFAQCINELEKTCHKLPKNDSCTAIVSNYRGEIKQMNKNANYVKEEQKHRRKRSINDEIGSIFEHVAGLPIYTLLYNPPDNWSRKTRSADQELLKQHLEDEKLVIEERQKMEALKDIYYDLREELALRSRKHYEQTNVFRNIFSHNIKNSIFEILDMEIFKNKIENISQSYENITLPTKNPLELIQICTIHTKKEDSHINIFIEIPLVLNESFQHFEIIPIPFKKGNKTQILDLDSFQYLQKDEIHKKIDKQHIDKCKRAMNITLCDAYIKTRLSEPINCELSLIYNSDCELTEFKTIDNENYLMYTSPTSLYVSTLKPMNLYISCIDSFIQHNITNDIEITFDKDCDIFTIDTSKITLNSTSIEIDLTWHSPNLTLHDINNTYIYNYTIIDKYNIRILDRINELQKIIAISENERIKEDESEITWWTIITNPSLVWERFKQKVEEINPIKWLCYGFALLIGFYILINLAISLSTSLLKKLICCKRK